jgi:hypothetical protein
MGRTTVDIRTIRVPADDGAFAQALAALDRKLADWSDAMRAAQQIVAAAAKTGPPAGNDSNFHTAAPNVFTIEVPPQAAQGQAAVPAVTVGPTAEDAASEDSIISRLCAPAGESADSPAGPAQAHCTRTGERPAAASPDGPAAKQEHAPSSDASDDEVLLASLEAETAKAIRVMRRLSPVRKSVRELLKEYEAARPTIPAAGQTKKKSWFSRGW